MCRGCQRTCGEMDQRRVEPARRESALAHYREGVGLRATERLVGVRHNAGRNWVLAAVEGPVLAAAKPEEVTWVEAAELGTYVGQEKRPAGCGGLVIVLPNKSAAGRWGIVEPQPPAAGRRRFRPPPTAASAPTSGTPLA